MHKLVIAGLLVVSAAVCSASDPSGAPGHLEGHLTIISPGTVQLAEEGGPTAVSKNYGAYSLIVRSSDRKKEIARVTPDANGDYRAELAPGEYLLDVERGALTKVKPKKFSVTSNQAVRVDMSLDTGVR